MNDAVVNINTVMMMGKIVSDITKTGDGANIRCEFDVETKRYTESVSKATPITCVSEGKQAELIFLQKKKGDDICFSGYLGEFSEFGSKPGTFGSHKIRITRIHFEYMNMVVYGGKIVTQPFYNDRYETTEFFIETERYRSKNASCRIRVIFQGYNAQFLRVAKDVKMPGSFLFVLGEISSSRGEHVILASRVEALISDTERAPIIRRLYELQKKEAENADRSKVRPPPIVSPAVISPGHAKVTPTPAGDSEPGDSPGPSKVDGVPVEE